MQSSSSMKRNIVLSLSILFVIGFASFGSIGGRVYAATSPHPLKSPTAVQPLVQVPIFDPTYSAGTDCKPNAHGPGTLECAIKPGDTLQIRFRYPSCDDRCGNETWYVQWANDYIASHLPSTFDPPVTTRDKTTTWTLRPAKNAPSPWHVGAYIGAHTDTPDQAIMDWVQFFFNIIPFEIVDTTTTPEKVVSGTTQTKIVGQRIQLGVHVAGLSNIQWKLSGVVIKDYIHGAISEKEAARPIDLSPAELQKADIRFYWYQGGNYTVTVSATYAGVPFQATVRYKILAPTGIDMKSLTTSHVVAGPTGIPNETGPYLNFGTKADPGITWTFRAIAPAGGDGEIAGLQLVKSLDTVTCNDGTVLTNSTSGGFVLDTREEDTSPLYLSLVQNIAGGSPGEWQKEDAPGVKLYPTDSLAFTRAEFEIYFMYKPAGDSIWVPIGRLDWYWTAETSIADPRTNTWNDPFNVDYPRNPVGFASEILPTWSANYTQFHWVPRDTC